MIIAKVLGAHSFANNFFCQECGVLARSINESNVIKKALVFETPVPREQPGNNEEDDIHSQSFGCWRCHIINCGVDDGDR
jgi:hypothetical protein